MKLQFDSSQEYQLAAIQSVVNIFEGQPLNKGNFDVSLPGEDFNSANFENSLGNKLYLSDKQILSNIQRIQNQNNIKQSDKLETCSFVNTNTETVSFPRHFTVEMETGTGKTYTYLRTIYELNKVYDFKKFVIVVPSVAIREGALKNLDITQEHFRILYGNQPVNFTMYNSTKIEKLRTFASADTIQILVINIDSFAKDSNIINTKRETGSKPIEYLQSTNPIVIVDEPQNMETEIRKAAIFNLNPLCTIRYSATHRNFYTLVYSLNPVQAYDLGLVKQIEVDGIVSDNNNNEAFIEFKGILKVKNSLKAKVIILVNDAGNLKQKLVTIDLGNDLFAVSNNREVYKNGFILNSIDAKNEVITFSNGMVLHKNHSQGGLTDEVMKFQIERTIKWHFEKEQRFKGKNIKVLSLFFIDKVENYRKYDLENKPIHGKFAVWFEELFQKYSPENYLFKVEEVHNGYFSQDKGKFKNTKGNTNADNDTYSLIMKDKERLLNEDEPLRFIFSHSALREGWDNPNVFQICTLNESKSELKKRQEIGRGLRLPVDRTGQRVWDKSINLLTVVANESYADFSKQLQKEIQEETGVDFSGRIKNAREKVQVKLSKALNLENFPLFFEIWEQLKQRTRYHLNFTTVEFTKEAADAVSKMAKTERPKLRAEKYLLNIAKTRVEGKLSNSESKEITNVTYSIPDIYGYIQTHINITRSTIFEILKQSGRIDEILINPQLFLDNAVQAIKNAQSKLLSERIDYEIISDSFNSLELFTSEERETYVSDLFEVTQSHKTLFNYVQVNNAIERQFAYDCEQNNQVEFYFKIPRNFEIPTPPGNYTPNWVVIFHNEFKNYYIVETTGILNSSLLQSIEKLKISCVKKHFELFKSKGFVFKQTAKVSDL